MTVPDLDVVEFIPAKNQRAARKLGGSGGTHPDVPRVIVIHTMECPMEDGRARSNAVWQRDTGEHGGDLVSSHLAIDPHETLRCVADENVAFTQATPWNDMALAIEQSGFARFVDEWASADGRAQVERVAEACASWCKKHGIPARFVGADELSKTWTYVSGITTHFQITLASQTRIMRSLGYKAGSHTDPGAAYPMEAMIARARALLVPDPQLPGDDEDMATEVKLIDSEGTHFVWNPPGNTFRWVSDGNIAAMEPAVLFAAVYQGSIPNQNTVDDGVKSLIDSAVMKLGPAPNAGQFKGKW